MKRFYVVFVCLFLVSAFSAVLPALAQSSFSEDDVIAIAASNPPFEAGLRAVPEWRADAYDTGNAYGIWRVQFYYADGSELGWADVQPARGRVYNYDVRFPASDEQRLLAEPVVRQFLFDDPDMIDLLGDPQAFTDVMYIDYNAWVEAWGVWIERGPRSLYVIVRFEGRTPDALENPSLLAVEFPYVLSLGEWQSGMQNVASAVAFQQPEIAAALRDISGWTTTAEPVDGALWKVVFWNGDSGVAEAQVDIDARSVTEFSVY